MSIAWTTEKRKISSLKENPKNPRKLTKEQAEHLRKSLERFGQCEPIVCNLDGTIIGGHQRIRTLKKQGIKEVDVSVPDRELTEKEVDELGIRLNKNGGEFDYEMLANSFDPIELCEWGFKAEELDIDVKEIEGDVDEDEGLLEPPKDPITKPGDIYQLGNHRVMCGDSTNPESVAALLGGAEPILMVTDPPYGVNYDPSWRKAAGKGTRAVGKVQNDDQVNWALAWNLFPGSVAYVWHAGKYCSDVHKSLEEAEFEIVSQIIWVKQHFAMSRGDYHWQHEPCWYAVKKGCKHNWQGSRKEATVWEIANLNCFGKSQDEDERTAHSTQKPIECMAKPITNNSAEGEGVYDPFLGSGTTLIAADKLKRACYGMELDPAYCDIIVKRWIDFQKKKGVPYQVLRNGEPFET